MKQIQNARRLENQRPGNLAGCGAEPALGESSPAAEAARRSRVASSDVVDLADWKVRRTAARQLPDDPEAGMATAEYAIATLAAVAFAALLAAVLGSGEVRGMLMSLIQSALSFG